MSELLQKYPAELALSYADRGPTWEKSYRMEMRRSVDAAITVLKLDKPWETMDETEKALADTLFESVLSCFGPYFGTDRPIDIYLALHQKSYEEAFGPESEAEIFTSNHDAVGVILKPLDSYRNSIEGSWDNMNMPTFVKIPGGKQTLGEISPISITQEKGAFQLHLTTPSGYMWHKQLERRKVEKFFNEPVGGKAGKPVSASHISQTCSFPYQVMILRPTCERKAADCAMCAVPRGDGIITPLYKEQVSVTLDKLIDYAGEGSLPFTQTPSGGSTNTPDGGFGTAQEWALGIIEKKVAQAEEKYKHKIQVKLELEMMLPPDEKTWFPILKKLYHYVKDLGWDISIATNLEAFSDEIRRLFIPGTKGALTREKHIKFAKILKRLKGLTGVDIGMASLGTFNMKPATMSYSQYMLEDLVNIRELIAVGIHPDIIPCKIKPGQELEAYPPPNPVYYMIHYFALKKMIQNAKLRPRHGGCVMSCGRCHHVDSTNRAMSKRLNIDIPQKLAPILDWLGPDYTDAFREIFS